MTLFLRPLATPSGSGIPSPIVLQNWLEAVEAFSNSYYQLGQYTASQSSNQLLPIPAFASTQSAQLLRVMRQELIALRADLDHSSTGSILPAHTARLKLLTNQAITFMRPLN